MADPTPARPAPAKFVPRIITPHTKGVERVSVLVQGPPGEGKTHFMSTWPNPFFLVFDPNTATHRRLGVPHALVQTWAEVERWWLPALKNRTLTTLVQSIELEDGTRPYPNALVETLCVDSVTFCMKNTVNELSRGATKDMGYEGWDKYYSRAFQLMSAGLASTKVDPQHPDRETYHFVASVHEAERSNDEGKLTGVVPAIQGSISSHFTAFFDVQLLTKVRFEGGKKKYMVTPNGDAIRKSKGDTVGSLSGLYPNDYQSLAKAWGWV